MIKILWGLLGLNSIGLLIFIAFFLIESHGRHVSYEEKGWTLILSLLALVMIIVAALTLKFAHSYGARFFAGFLAFLPVLITAAILISNKVSAYNNNKSFTQTFYKRREQRLIASAIEKNDTLHLKELLRGQNLEKRGISVSGEDGLTYLQFAVRLRNNPINFPFNDELNQQCIRILLSAGAHPAVALAEATHYLPPSIIALFLEAGADPNCPGFLNLNPLIFETIEGNKVKNDIAMLLVKSGANVNAIKDNKWTPLMYSAYIAGMKPSSNEGWRLVRFFANHQAVNKNYTAPDGTNFRNMILEIREKAFKDSIKMPPDFEAVLQKVNSDI